MKDELNIEELLNGFIDGELTARQQTEVQRLIAHDPRIAKRMQQLQKCRVLIGSLPLEEAPIDMATQVKTTLERQALLTEQPAILEERKGARYLMFRKVLATAAMITLVAVLAGVIYTIVSPEKIPTVPGFRGRLELQTSSFLATDTVISKAIKDNGLAGSVTTKRQRNKNIYTLTCSRENLNLFLADLGSSWNDIDSATLFVETKTHQEPVVVSDVRIKQIIDLITPPKPLLTGGDRPYGETLPKPQDGKKVQLTIVVSENQNGN